MMLASSAGLLPSGPAAPPSPRSCASSHTGCESVFVWQDWLVPLLTKNSWDVPPSCGFSWLQRPAASVTVFPVIDHPSVGSFSIGTKHSPCALQAPMAPAPCVTIAKLKLADAAPVDPDAELPPALLPPEPEPPPVLPPPVETPESIVALDESPASTGSDSAISTLWTPASLALACCAVAHCVAVRHKLPWPGTVQQTVSPAQVVLPHAAPPTASPESVAGLVPLELPSPEPLLPPEKVEASFPLSGAAASEDTASASIPASPVGASISPASVRPPPPVGSANVHVPGIALVPLKAILATGVASAKHDCTSKQLSLPALPLLPKTRLSS